MRRSFKTMALALGLMVSVTPFAGLAPEANAAGEPVAVWLTTPDQTKLLNREADLYFAPDSNPMEATINVDENKTYQQIDGFGAAMTDSSAWLIANKQSAGQRDELMRKLFDREAGIGISYVRVPMGASDFALSNYTYDDMPKGQTDPELAHFSIEHDKAYIIPTLRQAAAINPDLKLMGTPWSPPAWMKTTDSLIKGSLKPEAYEPLAGYFVKFVQAYTAEGLHVDAVTPQNEPHFEPGGYPGMRMNAQDQANFVKNNLGPAFAKADLSTKIVVWDHNWDEPNYPIEVLSDPGAYPYIAGAAFHSYAGTVGSQQLVKDAFPDKELYFTESSGGEWAPDFGGNLVWDTQNHIIGRRGIGRRPC